jgi:hypothetical protein
MRVDSTSFPPYPFRVPELFILFTHISFGQQFACAELPGRPVRSTFMILPCLPGKVTDPHSSDICSTQHPTVIPH